MYSSHRSLQRNLGWVICFVFTQLLIALLLDFSSAIAPISSSFACFSSFSAAELNGLTQGRKCGAVYIPAGQPLYVFHAISR
ncbi:hypothetical protein K1719_028155 [Acacia pycnantha]|nr:hypothetical protein K1719_028155 [Acacia pycnantha]